jgi:predicted PurR-regulated permease PerM
MTNQSFRPDPKPASKRSPLLILRRIALLLSWLVWDLLTGQVKLFTYIFYAAGVIIVALWGVQSTIEQDLTITLPNLGYRSGFVIVLLTTIAMCGFIVATVWSIVGPVVESSGVLDSRIVQRFRFTRPNFQTVPHGTPAD